METHWIDYKKEDGVATLILNRPRALNALNKEMIDELFLLLKQVAEDGEVKVLILTGAGRAFCFGADVAEFTQAENREPSGSPLVLLLLEKAQGIIRLLSYMPKPTLAALNGFATGLGLDLALACDLRIAAERAKLAEAYISMGLVPDGGGTFFLPRLIGFARAAQLIFLGEPLSAAEAERMGLINRVVPNDQLAASARDWAIKLAKGPTLGIRLAKEALHKNLQGDLLSALQAEADLQKICLASEDHREAVRAFQEKRRPLFKGR
jgi:2-(1,2-epoxy-1,2-dihydrophenyl)acetyl-CoA isomerase